MSETPPTTPLSRIKSNIHAFYKITQLEQSSQNKQNLTQRYIPIYMKNDSGYTTIKIGTSNKEDNSNNNAVVDVESNIRIKRKRVNSKTCPPSAIKRNYSRSNENDNNNNHIQSVNCFLKKEDKASSTSRLHSSECYNNNNNNKPIIPKRHKKQKVFTLINTSQIKAEINKVNIGDVYINPHNNRDTLNNININIHKIKSKPNNDNITLKQQKIRLVSMTNRIQRINHNIKQNTTKSTFQNIIINRNFSANNIMSPFINMIHSTSKPKLPHVNPTFRGNTNAINFPLIEETKGTTRNQHNTKSSNNTIHIYNKPPSINGIPRICKQNKEYLRMLKEKYLKFLNTKSELSKRASPIRNAWMYEAIKHYRRKNYDPNDI